ncbi:hypothetical protein L6452_43580 [Arctium lappa]|uniref:Uncharacterized protein n=1 Tax=Arctium lappa TaxID=4217 RepID=A0ACB8XEJ5_ARCLA|nr:hypothetical protein L6452_43580 [Arctium lappa]
MPPQSWSSMPIEADAYPSYSTQQGLNHFDLNTDGLDLDADISESDESQKADRATWSVEEDKVLAMAYVPISTDPIVGDRGITTCKKYFNSKHFNLTMNGDQEIQEFWINEFKDDVEDEIDQIQLQLVEQRQNYYEEGQGSANRKKYFNRDREGGHIRLYNDYFSSDPVYGSEIFRRRFRMQRDLFLRIVNRLESHYPYFQQRVDAIKKKGLSPIQKCAAAIRQLAYGTPADHYDEYLRVAESTAIECILGSLDCMHWEWKNCPVAWKGQFTRGDHGSPTIILEAVASVDLWIWHAFFGIAGSRNDINSFPCPQDAKRKLFKQRQESARKDVERAFGVLQSRWSIIKGPSRMWYKEQLRDIMHTCIILHNMIVEDEGDVLINWVDDETDNSTQAFQGSTHEFQEYLQRNSEMRSNEMHHQLRADLVEYIWLNRDYE